MRPLLQQIHTAFIYGSIAKKEEMSTSDVDIMIITASDYRVSAKTGHHALTFEIAGLILGERFQEYFDFFDVCRRKRNIVDYDLTDVASMSELKELIEKVREFRRIVYDWLEKE